MYNILPLGKTTLFSLCVSDSERSLRKERGERRERERENERERMRERERERERRSETRSQNIVRDREAATQAHLLSVKTWKWK